MIFIYMARITMATDPATTGLAITKAITRAGVTIYDDLTDRPDLILTPQQLDAVLNVKLVGMNLNFPLRTRSKIVKEAVCRALGYPVPSSFRKTRPRFPGQNFDTYVQKANNLQIWNEELTPKRRYALIRVNDGQKVTKVRVVTGDILAPFDTTGTLTHKYQASSQTPVTSSALVSESDTERLQSLIKNPRPASGGKVPPYAQRHFLSIAAIYDRLKKLEGHRFPNPGSDQERNRGTILHEIVQRSLGGIDFTDTGQIPDVPEQLLEIKLQTSPTIDLGLVCPDSEEQMPDYGYVCHCDLRYAVFYAHLHGHDLVVDNVVVSTGKDFFTFFRKFEGLEINRKIQMHLPAGFFGNTE